MVHCVVGKKQMKSLWCGEAYILIYQWTIPRDKYGEVLASSMFITVTIWFNACWEHSRCVWLYICFLWLSFVFISNFNLENNSMSDTQVLKDKRDAIHCRKADFHQEWKSIARSILFFFTTWTIPMHLMLIYGELHRSHASPSQFDVYGNIAQ